MPVSLTPALSQWEMGDRVSLREFHLNSHDFDVRFNRSNQILDAPERAGYRAWTGAARALVVHAELVANQANHMQIAAVVF